MRWVDPALAEERHINILSPVEQTRLAGYRVPEGGRAFLAARALARIVISSILQLKPADVSLTAQCRRCGGPHGRPELPGSGLQVSITHTRALVGFACTRDGLVGIDVESESRRSARETIKPRVLAPEEQECLSRVPLEAQNAGFLRYWTRKEALLKAVGCGLTVSPVKLTVSGPYDEPRLLKWAASPDLRRSAAIRDLNPGHGCVGAIAFLDAKPRIFEGSGAELLMS